MPVIYTIDTKEKIIRTRCVGNVTLKEVIDHFRILEQDPDCPDHLDVLLDLTETTSVPAANQIACVPNELKRIQGKVRFGVCAMVSDRDVLFGMLRMFGVVAEPYFRKTRVFRETPEAEAWLMSQKLSA
jgi:hypothetical protein